MSKDGRDTPVAIHGNRGRITTATGIAQPVTKGPTGISKSFNVDHIPINISRLVWTSSYRTITRCIDRQGILILGKSGCNTPVAIHGNGTRIDTSTGIT